jgi:7-alpha-hydroxysteroid dehydrogenase
MGRLDGRAAIVAGASRGLRRAIALAMATEGAAVAVVARTKQMWDARLPETVFETVEAISAVGGRAVAVCADLLEEPDRARVVAEARAALGPISILVNIAAFTAPGGPSKPAMINTGSRGNASGKLSWPTFLETPVRAYCRHFEMVFAAYELMQLVVPDMQMTGCGSIINVTSGASRMPGEGPYLGPRVGALVGYGGSKAALEHLTCVAAYEERASGIAINALSPSKPIRTPGVAYFDREFDDFAPASEFAEAAVRLALVDSQQVSGRILGHADVLDDSFRPTRFCRQRLDGF